MAEVEELQCRATEFYELGKELIASGLSFRFAVSGRSMFPFLRDGDVIEVVPAGIEDLHVGDIIFYRSGNRLLAHRVVGFITTPERRYARARGDAFLQEDPPIAGAALIGRVELVSRLRRDSWRQIPLNRGWVRSTGVVVARSKVAHRGVRWLSRTWLLFASGLRRSLGSGEERMERTVADVEKQKL